MCCCDEINVFESLSLDFFSLHFNNNDQAIIWCVRCTNSWSKLLGFQNQSKILFRWIFVCAIEFWFFSTVSSEYFYSDWFQEKEDDQRKHMRSYDQICLCVRKRANDMKQNFRMVAKKVENLLCTSRKVRFNAHHMPPQVEFSSWTVISSNIRSFHLFRFGQRTPCVSFTALKLLVHW